jgi:hypothetical protein
MKNLPDKIWLSEDRTMWLHNPYSTEYTEYVRKDAFIEKAWDWVEDNILSSNQQDKSRLYFEQFKTYIGK